MFSLSSSNSEDIRATAHLIKALLQKKSRIIYEINQQTIKKNYYQSNLNVREARDLRIRTKLFLKRVKDIKNTALCLKSAHFKKIPTSLIHKTMSLFNKQKSLLADPSLECSYFEIESQKTLSLQDIFAQKSHLLKELSQKHQRNEVKVHEIQRKKKKLIKWPKPIKHSHISGSKFE